ncbi:hypothetical protein PCE1_004708 [Barthelona sp. PCE]
MLLSQEQKSFLLKRLLHRCQRISTISDDAFDTLQHPILAFILDATTRTLTIDPEDNTWCTNSQQMLNINKTCIFFVKPFHYDSIEYSDLAELVDQLLIIEGNTSSLGDGVLDILNRILKKPQKQRLDFITEDIVTESTANISEIDDTNVIKTIFNLFDDSEFFDTIHIPNETVIDYGRKVLALIERMFNLQHIIDKPSNEHFFYSSRIEQIENVLKVLKQRNFVAFLKHFETIDINIVISIKGKVKELKEFHNDVKFVALYLNFLNPFLLDLETSSVEEFPRLSQNIICIFEALHLVFQKNSFYCSERNLNLLISSISNEIMLKAKKYLISDSMFDLSLVFDEEGKLLSTPFVNFCDNTVIIIQKIKTTLFICNFVRQMFFHYRNLNTSINSDNAWIELKSVDAFGELSSFIEFIGHVEEFLLRVVEFSSLRNGINMQVFSMDSNEWISTYSTLIVTYEAYIVDFLRNLLDSSHSNILFIDNSYFFEQFNKFRTKLLSLNHSICEKLNETIFTFQNFESYFRFMISLQNVLMNRSYFYINRYYYRLLLLGYGFLNNILIQIRTFLHEIGEIIGVEKVSMTINNYCLPNLDNDQSFVIELHENLKNTKSILHFEFLNLINQNNNFLNKISQLFNDLDTTHLESYIDEDITDKELKKIAQEFNEFVDTLDANPSLLLPSKNNSSFDSPNVILRFSDNLSEFITSLLNLNIELKLAFIESFCSAVEKKVPTIEDFFMSSILYKDEMDYLQLNLFEDYWIFEEVYKFYSIVKKSTFFKNGTDISDAIKSNLPSKIIEYSNFFIRFQNLLSTLTVSCRKFNKIQANFNNIFYRLLEEDFKSVHNDIKVACNDMIWKTPNVNAFSEMFSNDINILTDKAQSIFDIIDFIVNFFDPLSSDNRILALYFIDADFVDVYNENITHLSKLVSVFDTFNEQLLALIEKARTQVFVTRLDKHWQDFTSHISSLLVKKTEEALVITLQGLKQVFDVQEGGSFLKGRVYLAGDSIKSIPDYHLGNALKIVDNEDQCVWKVLLDDNFNSVHISNSSGLDLFVEQLLHRLFVSFKTLILPGTALSKSNTGSLELSTPRMSVKKLIVVGQPIIEALFDNPTINDLVKSIFSNVTQFAQTMNIIIDDQYTKFSVLFDSIKLNQVLQLDNISKLVDDVDKKTQNDEHVTRLAKFKVVASQKKFFDMLKPKIELLEEISDLTQAISLSNQVIFVNFDLSPFADSMCSKYYSIMFKVKKLLNTTLIQISNHIRMYLDTSLTNILESRKQLEHSDIDQKVHVVEAISKQIRDLSLNDKRFKQMKNFCISIVKVYENSSALRYETETLTKVHRLLKACDSLEARISSGVEALQSQITRNMQTFVGKIEEAATVISKQIEELNNTVLSAVPFGDTKLGVFSEHFGATVSQSLEIISNHYSELDSLRLEADELKGYSRIVKTSIVIPKFSCLSVLNDYKQLWSIFETVLITMEELDSTFKNFNHELFLNGMKEIAETLQTFKSADLMEHINVLMQEIDEIISITEVVCQLYGVSEYFWVLLSNLTNMNFSSTLDFNARQCFKTFFNNENNYDKLKSLVRQSYDEREVEIVFSDLESMWLIKHLAFDHLVMDIDSESLFFKKLDQFMPELLSFVDERSKVQLNLPYFTDLSLFSEYSFEESPFAQALHFPEILKSPFSEVVCFKMPIFRMLSNSNEKISVAMSYFTQRFGGKLQAWSKSLKNLRSLMSVLFNTNMLFETMLFCVYEFSRNGQEHIPLIDDIMKQCTSYFSLIKDMSSIGCVLDMYSENRIDQLSLYCRVFASQLNEFLPTMYPTWVARAAYLGYVQPINLAVNAVLIQKFRNNPYIFGNFSSENAAIQLSFTQLGPNTDGFRIDEEGMITHLIDQSHRLVQHRHHKFVGDLHSIAEFFGGFLGEFGAHVRGEWMVFLDIHPGMLKLSPSEFVDKLNSFDKIDHPLYMRRYHLYDYLQHHEQHSANNFVSILLEIFNILNEDDTSTMFKFDDDNDVVHYFRYLLPFILKHQALPVKVPIPVTETDLANLPVCSEMNMENVDEFVTPVDDSNLIFETKYIDCTFEEIEDYQINSYKANQIFKNNIIFVFDEEGSTHINSSKLKFPRTIVSNDLPPMLTPDIYRVLSICFECFSLKSIVYLHGEMAHMLPMLRLAFLGYIMAPFYIFDCIQLANDLLNDKNELNADLMMSRVEFFVSAGEKTTTIACFNHFNVLPVKVQTLIIERYANSDCRCIVCSTDPNYSLPQLDCVTIDLHTHWNHSGSSILYEAMAFVPVLTKKRIPHVMGTLYELSNFLNEIYWILRSFGVRVHFNETAQRMILCGSIHLYEFILTNTLGLPTAEEDIRFFYFKRCMAYSTFKYLQNQGHLCIQSQYSSDFSSMGSLSLYDIVIKSFKNFDQYFEALSEIELPFSMFSGLNLDVLMNDDGCLAFVDNMIDRFKFSDTVVVMSTRSHPSSMYAVAKDLISNFTMFTKRTSRLAEDDDTTIVQSFFINASSFSSVGNVNLHFKNEGFRISSSIYNESIERGFNFNNLPNIFIYIYTLDPLDSYSNTMVSVIKYAVSNLFYFKVTPTIKVIHFMTSAPSYMPILNGIIDEVYLDTIYGGIDENPTLMKQTSVRLNNMSLIAEKQIFYLDPILKNDALSIKIDHSKINTTHKLLKFHYFNSCSYSMKFGGGEVFDYFINTLYKVFTRYSSNLKDFQTVLFNASSRIENVLWIYSSVKEKTTNKLQFLLWLFYCFGFYLGVQESELSFLSQYFVAECQKCAAIIDNQNGQTLFKSSLVSKENISNTARSGFSIGNVPLKKSVRQTDRDSNRTHRTQQNSIVIDDIDIHGIQNNEIELFEKEDKRDSMTHILDVYFDSLRNDMDNGKPLNATIFLNNYYRFVHYDQFDVPKRFNDLGTNSIFMYIHIFPTFSAKHVVRLMYQTLPLYNRNTIKPSRKGDHFVLVFENVHFASNSVLNLMQSVLNNHEFYIPHHNLTVKFENTSFLMIGRFNLPVFHPVSSTFAHLNQAVQNMFVITFSDLKKQSFVKHTVDFVTKKLSLVDTKHIELVETVFNTLSFLIHKFKSALKQDVTHPYLAFSSFHVQTFAHYLCAHVPNSETFEVAFTSHFIFLLCIFYLNRLDTQSQKTFVIKTIDQAISHFFTGDVIEQLPKTDNLFFLHKKALQLVNKHSTTGEPISHDNISNGDLSLIFDKDVLRFRLFRALHFANPNMDIRVGSSDILSVSSWLYALTTPGLHITFLYPLSITIEQIIKPYAPLINSVRKFVPFHITFEKSIETLYEAVYTSVVLKESVIFFFDQNFWLHGDNHPTVADDFTALLIDSTAVDTKFNLLIRNSLFFSEKQLDKLKEACIADVTLGSTVEDLICERLYKNLNFITLFPPSLFSNPSCVKRVLPILSRTIVFQNVSYNKVDYVQIVTDLILILERKQKSNEKSKDIQRMQRMFHRSTMDSAYQLCSTQSKEDYAHFFSFMFLTTKSLMQKLIYLPSSPYGFQFAWGRNSISPGVQDVQFDTLFMNIINSFYHIVGNLKKFELEKNHVRILLISFIGWMQQSMNQNHQQLLSTSCNLSKVQEKSRKLRKKLSGIKIKISEFEETVVVQQDNIAKLQGKINGLTQEHDNLKNEFGECQEKHSAFMQRILEFDQNSVNDVLLLRNDADDISSLNMFASAFSGLFNQGDKFANFDDFRKCFFSLNTFFSSIESFSFESLSGLFVQNIHQKLIQCESCIRSLNSPTLVILFDFCILSLELGQKYHKVEDKHLMILNCNRELNILESNHLSKIQLIKNANNLYSADFKQFVDLNVKQSRYHINIQDIEAVGHLFNQIYQSLDVISDQFPNIIKSTSVIDHEFSEIESGSEGVPLTTEWSLTDDFEDVLETEPNYNTATTQSMMDELATPVKIMSSINFDEKDVKLKQNDPNEMSLFEGAVLSCLPLFVMFPQTRSHLVFEHAVNNLISKQLVPSSMIDDMDSDKDVSLRTFKVITDLLSREFIRNHKQTGLEQLEVSVEAVQKVCSFSKQIKEKERERALNPSSFAPSSLSHTILTSKNSVSSHHSLDPSKIIINPDRTIELLKEHNELSPRIAPEIFLKDEQIIAILTGLASLRALSFYDPFSLVIDLVDVIHEDVSYLDYYSYRCDLQFKNVVYDKLKEGKVVVLKQIDLLIPLPEFIYDLLDVLQQKDESMKLLQYNGTTIELPSTSKIFIQTMQSSTHSSFYSAKLCNYNFNYFDINHDTLIRIYSLKMIEKYEPDVWELMRINVGLMHKFKKQRSELSEKIIDKIKGYKRSTDHKDVQSLANQLKTLKEEFIESGSILDVFNTLSGTILDYSIDKYAYFCNVVSSMQASIAFVQESSQIFHLVPRVEGYFKMINEHVLKGDRSEDGDQTFLDKLISKIVLDVFSRIPRTRDRLLLAMSFLKNMKIVKKVQFALVMKLFSGECDFDMLFNTFPEMFDDQTVDFIEGSFFCNIDLNAPIDYDHIPQELQHLDHFTYTLLFIMLKPDGIFDMLSQFVCLNSLKGLLGLECYIRLSEAGIDFGEYSSYVISSRYMSIIGGMMNTYKIDDVTDEIIQSQPIFGITSAQLDSKEVLRVLCDLPATSKVVLFCDVHSISQIKPAILIKSLIANDGHFHQVHFTEKTILYQQTCGGFTFNTMVSLSLMQLNMPRIGSRPQVNLFHRIGPVNVMEDIKDNTYRSMLPVKCHPHQIMDVVDLINSSFDSVVKSVFIFPLESKVVEIPMPELMKWLSSSKMIDFINGITALQNDNPLILNESIKFANSAGITFRAHLPDNNRTSTLSLFDRLQNLVNFISISLNDKLSITREEYARISSHPLATIVFNLVSSIKIIRQELINDCNKILDALKALKQPCSDEVYALMYTYLNDLIPNNVIALLNPTSDGFCSSYSMSYSKSEMLRYPLHDFIGDIQMQIKSIKDLLSKICGDNIETSMLSDVLIDHPYCGRANPIFPTFFMHYLLPEFKKIDYEFDMVVVLKENIRGEIAGLIGDGVLSKSYLTIDQFPINGVCISYEEKKEGNDEWVHMNFLPSMINNTHLPLAQVRICRHQVLQKHPVTTTSIKLASPMVNMVRNLNSVLVLDSSFVEPHNSHAGIVALSGWATN